MISECTTNPGGIMMSSTRKVTGFWAVCAMIALGLEGHALAADKVRLLIEDGAMTSKTDSKGHTIMMWDLFADGEKVGHSEWDASTATGDYPTEFQITLTLVLDDGATLTATAATIWTTATDVAVLDPSEGTDNTRMVSIVNASVAGTDELRSVTRLDYRSLVDLKGWMFFRCRHCVYVLSGPADSSRRPEVGVPH
jgi:hypothetical protein